jgi:hypothetical protein
VRRYIRHSTDLPVDVRMSRVVVRGREYLRNISRGGLCFRSTMPLTPGLTIEVEIPVAEPVFRTGGVVAWCRPAEGRERDFEVGVSFSDVSPVDGKRLVDQVCHIEHYKREIWLRQGRWLTGEEAALEWLSRHSALDLDLFARAPALD